MNKLMCRFEATMKKKKKKDSEPIFRHALPALRASHVIRFNYLVITKINDQFLSYTHFYSKLVFI